MPLSDHEIDALTNGRDNTLHSHSYDRRITHKSLDDLQAIEKVTNVTTTYAASYQDDYILCDTTGGAFTVTLLPSKMQKEVTIIRVKGAGNVTVAATGPDTINGAATAVIAVSNTPLRLKAFTGWGWVNR